MKQMTRTSKVSLWSIQGLLAALFLFAGGMKLVMPIEMMKGPVELPGCSCGSSACAKCSGRSA